MTELLERRTAAADRGRAGDRRTMSELLALGASHKTAPLAVRERLALLDGQVEPFLHELVAHPEVTEAVAVSTCNRTELYVVGERPGGGESPCRDARARGAADGLGDAVYTARNCDAARHLYRVVCGLESMIVGEAEIQGQVKRAYERALAARTTGPMTNKLFRAALATGKRVRTETRSRPATPPWRRSPSSPPGRRSASCLAPRRDRRRGRERRSRPRARSTPTA